LKGYVDYLTKSGEGYGTTKNTASFNWYSTPYICPGSPAHRPQAGWYSGSTFITASYQNPSTGLAYTPSELEGLMGGGLMGGGGGTTTTDGGTTTLPSKEEYIANMIEAGFTQEEAEAHWNAVTTGIVEPGEDKLKLEEAGAPPTYPTLPQAPTVPTTTPTFGEGAGAGIPTPEVTPAPAYEISPEQQEMMDLLGTTITDWVTSGGYGLPPEIQAQMIQQQTDTLKAREQENIRVMKNNMERRGITNSGYVQANMNMITSNTSVAIAGAIADVQIKSALMKMASFEKAMGAAAQFLGYLSEQSQLAYAPKFATWQAEQLAKMQVWQGKLDIYKMELNQAYQTQNIELQAKLTSELAEQQHRYDIELAQMEIDAAQEMAKQEAAGSVSGSLVTGLFALGAAFL